MLNPFILPEGAEVRHEVPEFGGDQFRFAFPNGWGASVVRHRFSYGYANGLWELAVFGKDGHIDYTHPVAEGDVRGHLSEDDVNRLLLEIAATAPDAIFQEPVL